MENLHLHSFSSISIRCDEPTKYQINRGNAAQDHRSRNEPRVTSYQRAIVKQISAKPWLGQQIEQVSKETDAENADLETRRGYESLNRLGFSSA
jgi:hypothetical protein